MDIQDEEPKCTSHIPFLVCPSKLFYSVYESLICIMKHMGTQETFFVVFRNDVLVTLWICLLET